MIQKQKNNHKSNGESKKTHRICVRETEAIDFGEEMSAEEKEYLKRRVLEKMHNDGMKQKKKHGWKSWKVAVAAAAVVVIMPSSVIAASKAVQYFYSQVKTDGYQVDLKVKKDNTVKGTKEQVQPMLLKYEMSKAYTVKTEKGEGWYNFCHKQGFDAGKDFSLELIQVDQTVEKNFLLDDVGEQEEINVNGNKGVYAKFNGIIGSRYNQETEPTSYTQRVVVFYEKEGYILQFYAMGGIEKEELLQYVSKITLQPCKKEQASSYVALSEYLGYNSAEVAEEPVTTLEAEYTVVPQGKTAVFHGIEYEVKQVQVSDTIAPIIKENGKGINDCMGIWENRLEFSDKDGTLKSYIRETLQEGDGHTSPCARVVGSKEVAQKLVMVELRVKNTTEQTKEDVQVCMNMEYMTEKNGVYVNDDASYCRPKVVEDCQLDNLPQYFKETNEGKGYYLKDLKPGQEEVYHIGYFVDEDYLDKMFLTEDCGVASAEGNTYEGIQLDIR